MQLRNTSSGGFSYLCHLPFCEHTQFEISGYVILFSNSKAPGTFYVVREDCFCASEATIPS